MGNIGIHITEKIRSRIISGPDVAGIARYLRRESVLYIVCDKAVRWVADIVSDSVHCPVYIKEIEAEESLKTMDGVMDICSWLLGHNATRKTLLLAVGGGITSDMTGFAASIYKRGCRFAYLPTTLLAQVDAAIGGKTGVNFNHLKNMLGIIRQPEFTYECAQVLRTLPYADLRSGMAEMLKTFIIRNPRNCFRRSSSLFGYDFLMKTKEENRRELASLIASAAAIKAGIVSGDMNEKGERRKLNLGHTFAHAIEWMQQSTQALDFSVTYSHGEAVAIGMVCAAELSEVLGIAKPGLAHELEGILSHLGLPTVLPCPIETLAEAMSKDKKASGGKVDFVLIRRIGKVEIKPLAVDDVVAALKGMKWSSRWSRREGPPNIYPIWI